LNIDFFEADIFQTPKKQKIQLNYDENLADEFFHYKNYLVNDLRNILERNEFCNVLEFHKQIQNKYPTISSIAFDYLGIPTSSADCESIASLCKIVLNDRRSTLNSQLFEAIVMEKYNDKLYQDLENANYLKKKKLSLYQNSLIWMKKTFVKKCFFVDI